MKSSFSMLHAPQFITGRGSVSFIETLGRKRIGIVSGGRSFSSALKQQIEAIAKTNAASICYLTSIRSEPFIDDIFECMERVREFEPDLILAIGGGSVLDTAKAIHLFYENPDLSFEDALIPFTLPRLGKKALHVSIPTTSGTGSETTSAAVFIDPGTRTKKLLLDNTLVPHYAVLDANTTISLPDTIRITTAMDALTHAIEAGTAANASIMVRSLAMEAAVDILENIVPALDPDCPADERLTAQEKLHIASAFAGIAITNSCTGIAHSYDHPGPAFAHPHGLVCGLMLPYTIKLCAPHPSYATIAGRLGYQGTKKERSDALVEHLLQLMEKLSLPIRFLDLEIDESEYFLAVPTWSKISLTAFATQMSPAGMTYEKGLDLYRACYYGI